MKKIYISRKTISKAHLMLNRFPLLLLSVILINCPINVLAQETNRPSNSASAVSYPVLNRLENSRNAAHEDQLLGTYLSFMGDTEGAIKAFEKVFRDSNVSHDPLASNLKTRLEEVAAASAESALKAIVAEANNRQIVILNEYHHIPMQRAFAMRLARELRKIGYEYLAVETFTTDDMSPLANGFVEEFSGFYSKEPMFANFLRDAIQEQWKFVSFEAKNSPSISGSEFRKIREIRMAENIIDRVLKNNPKAKIFIYTGRGHAYKQPIVESSSDRVMMAAHLKRLTGIDPLSIDQTQMISHFLDPQQIEIYNAAKKKYQMTEPIVLKNVSNEYLVMGQSRGKVDMQVVFPEYKKNPNTGRSTWYSALAELTPKEIPQNFLPTSKDRLIYVYHKSDPENAAPVDVILVKVNMPAPKLMLPKGEFRFAFEE